MRRIVFLLLILAWPTAASAKWYRASSEHFIVYADDSERDVRRFAETLEKYHSAMSFLTQWHTEPPTPSGRVTIFAVGSDRTIRRLYGGDDARNVAGFYSPRASGSYAFVPDINSFGRKPRWSMTVLLHEYAHHFVMNASRFGMPRWMNEGAAEFYASMALKSDGGMMIGRPAQHRGPELFQARKIEVAELIDESLRGSTRGFDAFYGRSWLLYHYLTFNEERSGQMTDYRVNLANGMAPLEAAEAAFGDLDELDDEVEHYLAGRRMKTFDLPADTLSVGTIDVREVSEGMAEMMPLLIRSKRGVNREQALELVVEAREVAQRFPDDAGVLAALAEAEFDSGNDDAAIAAADRALAIDDTVKNAYVQKGYALFRRARDAEDKVAAYKEAMRPFTRLNKLENDHPLPLIYYYRSFVERGEEPSDHARRALERASELAPFDLDLAMQVGVMQAQQGEIGRAYATLRPVAFNPHGGTRADVAQAFMEALETAEPGSPLDMQAIAAKVPMLAGGDGSDEE